MSTALFVGRFQPFHRGHLSVIKDLLHAHQHVNIVIGSAQESRTEKNPFSADEREEMIRRTLEAEHIPKRYSIFRIEDVFDDEKWSRSVMEMCRFDIAYTNNEWTRRCLEAQGVEVKNHKFYDKAIISGTRIRELIRSGSPEWEELVSAETAKIIKKIMDTQEGLQKIADSP